MQISGYAVALAENIRSPMIDWAKVESGLGNAPFNDTLQEFEQTYYLRQRDLEAFCLLESSTELPENYQEWFAQARVDCDKPKDNTRPTMVWCRLACYTCVAQGNIIELFWLYEVPCVDFSARRCKRRFHRVLSRSCFS